jgi:nucleoside-diphosphate-sugar epimerase
MQGKILVLGACGQIGVELVESLRAKYGAEQVVASDIQERDFETVNGGPFELCDAADKKAVEQIIAKHQITEVYQLVALLSATSEKNPSFAWELNMGTLMHLLDVAKEGKIKKIFWPSSIAVFGPSTPKHETPQYTVMDPSTVYGISKLAGERWCEYYHKKYQVDVRSLRYPGLIGYKSSPGGGTTDYAVDIFYKAIEQKQYTCFLSSHTALPMMMMEDAIRATIQIMSAPEDSIRIRSSYNISGMSFTPQMLAEEIRKFIPDFQIDYNTDFRQQIAESWPKSISDVQARTDWGWKPEYDLAKLTKIMLSEIQKKFPVNS